MAAMPTRRLVRTRDASSKAFEGFQRPTTHIVVHSPLPLHPTANCTPRRTAPHGELHPMADVYTRWSHRRVVASDGLCVWPDAAAAAAAPAAAAAAVLLPALLPALLLLLLLLLMMMTMIAAGATGSLAIVLASQRASSTGSSRSSGSSTLLASSSHR